MNQKDEINNWLATLLKSNLPILVHLSVTLSCLLILGLITATSYFFSNVTTDKWINLLNSSTVSDADRRNNFQVYLTRFQEVTDAEELRIREQLQFIRTRAGLHIEIAKDFYKWLFISTCITGIAGTVAGICLFYISKEGWEKSNKYVMNVFIVSSSLALFSFSLPKVYGHEKNAGDNLKVYLAYISLENKTLTRLAVDQPVNENPSNKEMTSIQIIIRDTESAMDELNRLSIQFDSNSIVFPRNLSDNLNLQE